jgi:biotin transport system substrate-specific component
MEVIKKIESDKIIKILLISLLGTLILTISAKIKIPFYPVPMTMQTFVVLFLGITLGAKIGTFIISLYLIEGILGLPVFAGTPEKGMGLVYFTGPTMGYLLGFLVATYFAGSFKYDKGFLNTFLKLIFSVSFIYIIGMIWLGTLIGWDKPIFKLGAEPFLLAELFKMLILTIMVGYLDKLKKLFR